MTKTYEELEAELATMTRRAEKAESDIRIMVQKAADKDLQGYRELGNRCAMLEAERDLLRGRLAIQNKQIVELDSFCHYQIIEKGGRRILLEFSDECPNMGDRDPYTEEEAHPRGSWVPGEQVIFVTSLTVSTGKVTGEVMCGDDFIGYHIKEDT